jgi:hypothetical protein
LAPVAGEINVSTGESAAQMQTKIFSAKKTVQAVPALATAHEYYSVAG